MTSLLDPVSGGPRQIKSDLGVRTLSAAVMVAIAGTALWLGGWFLSGFVAAVGLGVLWEWWGLARRIAVSPWGRALWMLGGAAYIGAATASLIVLGQGAVGLIAVVIAVDVGAYAAGRSIGGPKIAPRISPGKTWAGLIGGAVAASIVLMAYAYVVGNFWQGPVQATWIVGPMVAIVAQAGDLFESWMKRRAGVKDSGRLIPGHGGLFDRVDGLLPLAILAGGARLLFIATFTT